jgi:hypothetical protein
VQQRNDGAGVLHTAGCLNRGIPSLLQAQAKLRVRDDAAVNQGVGENRAKLQKISFYLGSIGQRPILFAIVVGNPPMVRRFHARP